MKKVYNIDESDSYRLVSELADFTHLIDEGGHFQLGREGVVDYLTYEKSLNPNLDVESIIDEIKKKSRVFLRTPEEIRSRIFAAKAKRENKKKGNQKEERTSPASPPKQPDLKKSQVSSKSDLLESGRSPKKVSKSKKSSAKTVTATLEVDVVKEKTNTIVKPNLAEIKPSPKIDEKEKKADIIVHRPEITLPQQGRKISATPIIKKKENPIASIEAESIKEEINELPRESPILKVKEDIQPKLEASVSPSVVKIDNEFDRILQICVEVSNRMKGMPITQTQILEEAKKIDPKFADLFFNRFFHTTILPEIAKFKPSTYISF